MSSSHKHSASVTQNHKAQLANAYNELGKELSSSKIKVVGNYTLGKAIGEGAYGKVRLGTHRLTSTRVAIKQIPKSLSATLTREIHHHRRLHHPHIAQLYEVIATESSIWLVTELCSGGELFDYLAEKGRLEEGEARGVFGQLCLAVGYCHEKGVVHRDLKLENVLLDERCRVKLGDFGFTREYERGALLETFCGTTGYASPEMLQGQKYLGPEVDIWSLGIILYCLLTGTLPFDDDDEMIMRDKIIFGEYVVPDWLSVEAQDLIRNIIQHDPSKRLTITQILGHGWFSPSPPPLARPLAPHNTSHDNAQPAQGQAQASNHASASPSSTSLTQAPPSDLIFTSNTANTTANGSSATTAASESTATSPSSFHSASSRLSNSTPTTPDDSTEHLLHANASQSTLKKPPLLPLSAPSAALYNAVHTTDQNQTPNGKSGMRPWPTTVVEEDSFTSLFDASSSSIAGGAGGAGGGGSGGGGGSSGSGSRPPSSYPTRTPARTKRRSVSSILSQPSSPTDDDIANPSSSANNPSAPFPPQDYASLLTTPAPLLFSTPLERGLLNGLASVGFDTGQMVHSVLSDACDAAGAVWWMVKRRAERRVLDGAGGATSGLVGVGDVTEVDVDEERAKGRDREKRRRDRDQPELDSPSPSPSPSRNTSNASLISLNDPVLPSARSAPQLAFVPPTPTLPAIPPSSQSQTHNSNQTQHRPTPTTPPRSKSPRSLLSSADSAVGGVGGLKSNSSTPGSSLREKGGDRDRDKGGADRDGKDNGGGGSGSGSRGRRDAKQRSGSVSIMQRATTALEAAGLVRKKSGEVVRDRERDGDKGKDKDHHKSDKDKDKDEGNGGKDAHEKEKKERATTSSDRERGSYGALVTNRLTKSPPPGRGSGSKEKEREKEKDVVVGGGASPTTPERETTAPSGLQIGSSPWVMPISKTSSSHPDDSNNAHAHASIASTMTPSNSPGDTITSLPRVNAAGKLVSGATRNRNSLLSTFRMWFNEDRKGKRKANVSAAAAANAANGGGGVSQGMNGVPPSPANPRNRGTIGRRGSGSGAGNVKHRGNRPSVSSRRSSSVNSRRSSVASITHMVVLESPLQNVDELQDMPYISRQRSDPSRRSFTPNSEADRDRDRADYQSSRPSSIHSYTNTRRGTRHKKSPSTSSAGSGYHHRTASPLQKYHRRAGSGSSTTVVRQARPSSAGGAGSGSGSGGGGGGAGRVWHVRSSSTTSSVHSLPSSRPVSFYEPSEGEGQRTGSPLLAHAQAALSSSSRSSTRLARERVETPKRGSAFGGTVLAAHKKTTPFTSPFGTGGGMSSYGKMSWKKAWGTEPPGWQSRPTQLPVEVLVISPAGADSQAGIIRDVFSGRPSLSLGDEDDWVDEDDDVPAFAGGLGQTPTSASSFSAGLKMKAQETPMLLAPAPRGKANRTGNKRGERNASSSSSTVENSNNLVAPPSAGGGAGRTGNRSKPGHSPVAGNSPLPGDTGFDTSTTGSAQDGRVGRRQLPAGRSGPAFRHPIQEEDEDEEE